MANLVEERPWVLVTGGSRGIGKGIVSKLVDYGYAVVFTYQFSADEAQAMENILNQNECCVVAAQCDGRDYDAVSQLCSRLLKQYGSPLGLVNNMGRTGDELIMNLDKDCYKNIIACNLDSSIYFIRALAQAMCEAGAGSIIQMSSVTGIKGNPGQVSYAATKAAMIGVTKTLAQELARFNVRVNAIAPGFIETEMVAQLPPVKLKGITKKIPLKRMGRVEEVADLTEFLIGNRSQYITGQTFVIDGGMTA